MIVFSNMSAAGLIPAFLDEQDPRPAREQIDERYAHGGGWVPFPGHVLRDEGGVVTIQYPGDPPRRVVSRARLRDEELLLFEGAWLVIRQPDGSWECARVD